MLPPLSRRSFLQRLAAAGAALGIPVPLAALDPERYRFAQWTAHLRAEGLARDDVPLGKAAARVGELAAGTPYEAGTLETYLKAGGNPLSTEPLTLLLTRFDCVSLVESCLAIGRVARREGEPTWERFGREVEWMRYRGGVRGGYSTRLHYFSEWIADGARRGLVRDLGPALGAVEDRRPLRFMTEHRGSYPALAHEGAFREVAAMERELDGTPRWVVPSERIPGIADQLETGDVLAFATGIPGLDVTHTALAWRAEDGALRVLHAPLSGGVVEVTRTTLADYVAAIRRSTGILVARPV